MANVTTVARPYAKAILALAKASNDYAVWTSMLGFLSQVVQDPLGRKVISNLAILPQEKAAFLLDVGNDFLNDQGKNLVKLLAKGKRLLILPELFNVYEVMRKKAENLVFIKLTLAEDVDQQELDTIQNICNNIFTGEVILSEHIEKDLISGGIAQIGNRVIDASITGRLQSMRNMLRK